MIGFISGIALFGALTPQTINTESEKSIEIIDSVKVTKTMQMVITAYSSTEDQTDSTPFITASNKRVRDGIIATNGIPFGTKVRIVGVPELAGKTFIVEDRMHRRKIGMADIWMDTTQKAKTFGVKGMDGKVYMEILES